MHHMDPKHMKLHYGYILIRVDIYAYLCKFTYICTYICVYVYIYVCLFMYIYICIFVYIYIYLYICIYIYTYIDMYIKRKDSYNYK
jgi:hypothetical protein